MWIVLSFSWQQMQCVQFMRMYCVLSLFSVHAQCRDISSENQRALTIGQQVCFRCPLQGSSFTWRFLVSTILPSGAQAVANGTLVISSVAQVHLDPNFFTCQADGGPLSEPYRLFEACKLHACMFPPPRSPFTWRVLLTLAGSS